MRAAPLRQASLQTLASEAKQRVLLESRLEGRTRPQIPPEDYGVPMLDESFHPLFGMAGVPAERVNSALLVPVPAAIGFDQHAATSSVSEP